MKYIIGKSRDRIMNGAIAGIVAGSIQTIYAMAMKFFHFTDREFIDYGEILIMGRDYPGTASIVGIVAHLINAAVLGALFSLIMTISKPRRYIIKGVGLGIFVWLFSLGLATLFKIPMFNVITPPISYIMLAGAILWGAIMGFIFKKLQGNVSKS